MIWVHWNMVAFWFVTVAFWFVTVAFWFVTISIWYGIVSCDVVQSHFDVCRWIGFRLHQKRNRFHLDMQHNLQSIIETFWDDLKRQTYCIHVYTFLTDLLMLHLPLLTCIARAAMHWFRFQLVTHFSFIVNFHNLFHDEQLYLDFQNAEIKWERTHIERISVDNLTS